MISIVNSLIVGFLAPSAIVLEVGIETILFSFRDYCALLDNSGSTPIILHLGERAYAAMAHPEIVPPPPTHTKR